MCEVLCIMIVFFFKQNTAYEMRISDWSSDVCSSDLDPSNGVRGRADLGLPSLDRRQLRNGQAGGENGRAIRSECAHLFTPFQGGHGLCAVGIREIGRESCRERACVYV